MRLKALAITLLTAGSLAGQVLLEDFSTMRLGPGGLDLWAQTANPHQTAGIEQHDGDMRLFSTVFQAGRPSDTWYVHFYPNARSPRYPWPQGFTQSHLLSGTWDPLINHMQFWVKCTGNKPFNQWRTYNIGTYVKHKNDDPNWQGHHYYHHLHAEVHADRWIKNVITWRPNSRVGESGATVYPPDPQFGSPDGQPFHYFDGLTRWYLDFDDGLDGFPFTCWVDDVEFYRDDDTPFEHIGSVTATYTGTAYQVSFNARKNVKTQYEIRYSPQSMRVNGWNSGTSGGKVSNPGSAYGGTIWKSAAMPEDPNGLYFAIKADGDSRFAEVFFEGRPGGGNTPPPPPPPPLPNPPSDLSGVAVSHGQVDLVWRDNSHDEDGFEVERCSGVTCSGFSLLGSAGAGTNTYNDTAVSAFRTYRYRVRAVNAAGPSGYSNEVEITTQARPCDVDGDGDVDQDDITAAQQQATGRTPCTLGDANWDGGCDVSDVVAVLVAANTRACLP